MYKHNIPGMAVAITVDGEHRIFNFGVASRETGAPVEGGTLFEVGSISKTFAGLLAAYAHQRGALSFFDEVSDYFPALKGTSFDDVSVLDLATHTSGLDVFLPRDADTVDALLAHVMGWKGRYSPGTHRTYSNIGAVLLGALTAEAMKTTYDAAIRETLLPLLGLSHTYLYVPPGEMLHYAQGYTTGDEPARRMSGPLTFATHGIRTTAADMIRYVEAHMGVGEVEAELQQAIGLALTGYFKAGPLTQNLMWEQYAYPVSLEPLLEGNSRGIEWDDVPAMRLKPPFPPRKAVLINKTGSTNGFSAYVAFVPGSRVGVAVLANKSIPVPDQVKAGYRILETLLETRR